MCVGRPTVLLGLTVLSFALDKSSLHAATAPCHSGELFEVLPFERGWQPNAVTSIVQSHDGYLWVGTYHGLVRFDGVTYTVFDTGNAPNLGDGRITSLYESPEQVLWIGHETGRLTRRANRDFQSVDLGSNWAGGAIEAITSDEQGDVWLLNDTGLLYRVRDGKTAEVPGGASSLRKATLARARDGKIWMSSNGQLATLEQGTVAPVRFPVEGPSNFYERVFTADDGGVWILGNGRLRKWREDRWEAQVEGFPRTPAAVDVVVETRSGLLAGTMRDGLYLLRFGCEPLHFSRTNGLSHDWVRALFVDQEDNCWIGTGVGLDSLRPRKVRMVAPADGWQGCVVRSFSVHSDGTAWVGTEGAGLYRYDGRQWTVYGPAAGLLSVFVWSVLETRQQELFVGTWGGGLFRRNGERFESSGELSKITAPVTALYQGRGGELWIGTQEGLHRYEAGRLVWFAGKDKLSLPDVRTITESADGTLWFGMAGGGLGSLREGALKQFRKSDGLGSDLISCLAADPDGTLWIGTTDNGLSRLAKGKFSSITPEQGLPGKLISHIVDDGAGRLWLGSQDGILRVNKAELQRCADGQLDAVHCLSYGATEGLTTQTCSDGFLPGACKTKDGRLWFPTVKGLAVVDLANVTTNAVPPPVVIEELLLDGTKTNNWLRALPVSASAASPGPGSPGAVRAGSGIAKPLRIPPGYRRFEFHYTALSFIAPDKVRFRRKLEGLQNDWVDVGGKRSVEYPFLPPGNYTFKVIACNNDEIWNETGASVAFTVLPHFWQTIVFQGSSMAAGVGTVAVGILWTVRRRHRRKLEYLERQNALERERARIARDIHDDLGASLTRISMLSETVRGELQSIPAAAGEVEQIHSTAREITRAMDEIVWAVNPKYDTLDSLAAYLSRFAQQYLGAAGIRCRLKVPVQLPTLALSAEVRHNVFLAFKETLNNVVKHAQASQVLVSLELRPTEFVLIVVDDGRGFELNPRPAAASATADGLRCAGGNGLLNIEKRMEEIHGRCVWDTAPGQGTRTTFTVALR
jgi:ligand-binding sensor domain-containing protein/signal transduction histidine kinase